MDLVESIALYRPYVTVLIEERRYISSEKFAQVKEERDRYEALVRDLVAEGMQTGECRRDIDPRIVTFAIFGMCNWTCQWLRPGEPLTPRQVGELFASVVLEGLRR